MGHIKEPKGVDFVIDSDPLTDETRNEFSTFIQAYKAKVAKKKAGLSSNTKPAKTSQI